LSLTLISERKMSTKNLVFKSLHISHASNDSAATLFRSTYELAIPVRNKIGTTADAILTKLITDTDVCAAQTHRQRKSALTEDVKALRKTCNDLLAEVKRTISFQAKSSNKPLNKAGNELKFFFKPNWNVQKSILPTQIEMTALLIEKYCADAELVAAAQVIGVDTIITELEITNSKLEKLFLDRNFEVGSRPASGTDLRPAANESYMQFCIAIEQAAYYTPNDDLIRLFGQMNQYRKITHKLMAGKKNKEL